MHYIWLQSSIRANRLKTVYLLLLLPGILFCALFLVFFLSSQSADAFNDAIQNVAGAFVFVWPLIIIRGLISFFWHRYLIFSFTWAKQIDRKTEPEIYNIVENLAISKWLPVPKIGVMEDDSLNAFALWRNAKNSRIVFSRWIINKLTRREIEAVAGHELTHIINKDCLLMVTVVVFVWIIWTLGEIMIRMRSSSNSDNKSSGYIQLIWFVLMMLWYLIFPLIQLAISRKREYLADAWSVELTKDKQSMIDALRAISKDSVIESISKQTVAAMCIESPLMNNNWKKSSFWSSLFATHPTIEDRIKALENY
jgi:heat shock protein HtpX